MASKAPNTEKRKVHRCVNEHRFVYNCPKCGSPITCARRMHRNLCMNCGQSLDWSDAESMQSIYIRVHDNAEAVYWAEQYEEINGTAYAIDIGKWAAIRKVFPMLLYFSFPEGKAYGRFMRKASKEAEIMKDFRGG